MTPRERVNAAVAHRAPDRTPVDFLAVPEIWQALMEELRLAGAAGSAARALDQSVYVDPAWDAVLRALEVDCRVLSYDQFCAPPAGVFGEGVPEWWDVMSRSTPARMWRWKRPDGTARDIFGRSFKVQRNAAGAYEENQPVLGDAQSVEDLRRHPWPQPDWWDWSGVPAAVSAMNAGTQYHVRFRAGSVFEVAWQLRGLDLFMMDMALQPEIPRYIMERLTEVIVENIHRALSQAARAGDAVDMVYFYDDVAAASSLLVSEQMWDQVIRPFHQAVISAARAHGKQVMYHSDGALRPLIPRLVDMGVNVLNPLQPSASGMEPAGLKKDFGGKLAFHGGIDIVRLLPRGTPEEVVAEAKRLVRELGAGGGYVLASSHHIQADTPLANVRALYDTSIR